MRILFVGFPTSIHVLRWMRQVQDQGWDIHLFPSQGWDLNPGHRNITFHTNCSQRPAQIDPSVKYVGWWPHRRTLSKAMHLAQRFRPKLVSHTERLAHTIRQIRPNLIHSLEFQAAGYLTMSARWLAGPPFAKWAVTNYGSDIYLFGQTKEHQTQIENILEISQYYFCETERDIRLARDYGLAGEAMPVVPGAGGFDLQKLQRLRSPGPVSDRKLIMLKGYQGLFGRCQTALRAIEMCADVLRDYRILIYLCGGPEVAIPAEILARKTGLRIDIMPHTQNHDRMLRLHGRARMSIGLNISDGCSTSFLETIAMGSFPIQSNTAVPDEWIEDGHTGAIVHPMDPEGVAAAIRRAATDDELVNRAGEENWKTVCARLDEVKIRKTVIDCYKKMLGVPAAAQLADVPVNKAA